MCSAPYASLWKAAAASTQRNCVAIVTELTSAPQDFVWRGKKKKGKNKKTSCSGASTSTHPLSSLSVLKRHKIPSRSHFHLFQSYLSRSRGMVRHHGVGEPERSVVLSPRCYSHGAVAMVPQIWRHDSMAHENHVLSLFAVGCLTL